MTEKRYYAHKHLINEDKVHDKICHRLMNITETVEHMNMYYQKYTALKKENEQLKSLNNELRNELKISEKDYKVFNEVINYADELITKHLSEHYQRKWRKFCEIKGV